ncbi:hypothetical protein MAPG_00350 [Magnaporthiopsis poae ATCC 64411]|uniref:J domain-containing protein n=1 Tax=Magnaporthiopsis poae (strain ATCC 64411 / 73-15) TaxID=644358 RepID=A0A0C4DKS1_MAGP6|nr:hypothetical protein MAPG_00350 [Magnaporthiopsis poae ATCC 64411]
MDQSARLVAMAAEYAPKRDLYEILGLDAAAEPSTGEIHKAWKRMGLKYHPDKTGDKFDPELYESLEHARDVLTDADARAKYDGLRRAHLRKQQELEAMSAGRRRMINELEAAEAAARRQRTGAPDPGSDGDDPALAARKRAEQERRQQQNRQKFKEHKENLLAEQKRQEAEADAKRDAREAEIEQTLRERAEKKAAARAAKAKRKARKGGDSDTGPELGAATEKTTPTPAVPAPSPPAAASTGPLPPDAEGGPRDPLLSEDEARSFRFTKVQLMIHQVARDIQAAIDEHERAQASSLVTAFRPDKLRQLIVAVQETDVYLFEALGKPIPPRLAEFCASWKSSTRTTGPGDLAQVKHAMRQTTEDIQAQVTEYARVHASSPSTVLPSLAKLQKAVGTMQKADIYLHEALGEHIPTRLSSCNDEWERPGHPKWRGGWEENRKKFRRE